MKRVYIIVTTISMFLLFCVSCYYDNEEALYPTYNSMCDTTNVTYSVTIVSILSNNCYSCHSSNTAASSGNNIRLDSYAEVAARNVNISGSINHTGTFSPMPKNGGKLKACSINQFDIWVRKGMVNN
jgi:hypothetical protein